MDTTSKDVLKEKLISQVQMTENIDLDYFKKKIYGEKQFTTKDKKELFEFVKEFDEKKRSSFRAEFIVGDDKYVYCFDDMTIDRIFTAKQLFMMEQEYIKHLPNNPQEMQTLAKRQAIRTAYSAILMKKVDKGYEQYNINDDAFNALAVLTGKQYEQLQKCKEDFFLKTSMQDNEQLALLGATIEQLKGFDPSSLAQIMDVVLQTTDGQAGSNLIANFMTPITT